MPGFLIFLIYGKVYLNFSSTKRTKHVLYFMGTFTKKILFYPSGFIIFLKVPVDLFVKGVCLILVDTFQYSYLQMPVPL